VPTDRAKGRILRHDPASRAYAAPHRSLTPRSWRHRMGPVLDQGRVNGCTGWSGADWLNSALAQANRRRWNLQHSQRFASAYLGNDAGLELYKLATRADDFDWTYPPTDNGSSGLGVLKAMKRAGVIDRYDWTFAFEQMLASAQRQPVMLGTVWTDVMSDPDAKGVIHIGTDAQLKQANDDGEGHEYSLIGANWPRRLGRIRNHWSEDWGLGGEAWISLDELETLIMAYQGDCAVPALAA